MKKDKLKKLDINLILQGAINSVPIDFSKGKKTRLDIEFFKDSDFDKPLNPQSIQRILSQATESVTSVRDVCYPRSFHSSLKLSNNYSYSLKK